MIFLSFMYRCCWWRWWCFADVLILFLRFVFCFKFVMSLLLVLFMLCLFMITHWTFCSQKKLGWPGWQLIAPQQDTPTRNRESIRKFFMTSMGFQPGTSKFERPCLTTRLFDNPKTYSLYLAVQEFSMHSCWRLSFETDKKTREKTAALVNPVLSESKKMCKV